MEAASADDGATPTGGDDNFGFGDIALVVDAHVSLIDWNPNSGSVQPEAVYCSQLSLASGAVLNLNGLELYVAGQPVVVDPSMCPCPFDNGMITNDERTIVGDVCGNGIMDYDDITCFVSVLLGLDTIPLHIVAADVNGDKQVDGRDVQTFVGTLLGL